MDNDRLLIYSYSGNNSVIDRYIHYCLDHIKSFVSEIIIVINKPISFEVEKQFHYYSNKIYINENQGSSLYAYKTGLESYGWDNLSKYNEIVFMNDDVFGPVYNFNDLFDSMKNVNLSFWSIVSNQVPKKDDIISHTLEYVDIYFMVVRKNMFLHNEFKSFFSILLYDNESSMQEYFISKFTALGFQYGTYIDIQNLENYVPNTIIHAPKILIEKYKCPVFLKQIFTSSFKNWTVYSYGDEVIELLHYLEEYTHYDTTIVYDYIIKNVNQYDFHYYLHNNCIISERNIEKYIKNKLRTALMMHLYYEDLFTDMLEYAKNMPDYADIIISTQTEEKKQKLLQLTKDFPNKVKIIVIENRGRDVSSLTVAFREYIYNYDIVCFAHDKKVSQADYAIKGKTYEKHCFGNILPTKEYVINVINKFEEDKNVGLLIPPVPLFAEYYPAVSGYGCGWGINYHLCKELAERLNITLPIDENKAPTAPYGSIFWFRVDALKPLFELNLTYEDFPAEPVPCDGTISHAIERMHPYIAQSRGYYSAWIISDKRVPVYMSNLHYMLTEVNKKVYKFFPSNYFVRELSDIDDLKSKFDDMNIEINRLRAAHENQIQFLEASYNSVINSKSWKITAPLRYIIQLIKTTIKKAK